MDPDHSTQKNSHLLMTAVIAVATVFALLMLFRDDTNELPPRQATATPVVDVMIAAPGSFRPPLEVRGLVEPEQQLTLLAQVPGTVTKVSDRLAPGLAFSKGDILLAIETSHLNMELQKARSALAQATLQEQEARAQFEALQAIGDSARTELARGTPRLAVAITARETAQAAVQLAEQQLANAVIRAPFNGRTMARTIQQYEPVIAGRPLAQIYAIDRFLVRLPVTQEQLALITIPGNASSTGSPVLLRNESTGQSWNGQIVRSEGFIGPNRMINVIVRMEAGKEPLSAVIPGSLLLAIIPAQVKENVTTLPASALMEGTHVYRIDDNKRIQRKDVSIISQDANQAWVTGLDAGDRIVISSTSGLAENLSVDFRISANP